MDDGQTNKPVARKSGKSASWAWLVVAPISAVTLLFLIALYTLTYLGGKMAEQHAPLVDASMEVKFELSLFHLWFEELVQGDTTLTEDVVWAHLDRALWYANAMLKGGTNTEGTFLPLDDPDLRTAIEEVIAKSDHLRQVGRIRLADGVAGAIGSALDQDFDEAFATLIRSADHVEAELQRTIARELARYRMLSLILALLMVAVSVTLGVVAFRVHRGREKEHRQLKQSHHSLIQAREDLQRSNADLEQFAYAASHDLQEPLRSVSSYIDLLRKRYGGKLDEEAHEFINFAVDATKRMRGQIAGLLDLCRLQAHGAELVSLDGNEVLGAALANLGRAIDDRGAEITVGPLPEVKGDHSQLVNLFQNLIANALKFTHPGEPPRVHVGTEGVNSEAVFFVRDHGIGMESKQTERIFQIFQRLHPVGTYEGVGMGLALCRRIVERHGGRIWVESAPGEGATFFFTLPGGEEWA